MSKRQRDYRAEYQRRVVRGLTKGLSRSQARGHPKVKEKHIAPKRRKRIASRNLNIAAKSMSRGKSLATSAREVHITQEQLLQRLRDAKAVRKKNGRWSLIKNRQTGWSLFSEGQFYERTWVADSTQATRLSRYNAAVKKALREGEPGFLKPFQGQSVTDVEGRIYPLEANINVLFSLHKQATFEEVYAPVAWR